MSDKITIRARKSFSGQEGMWRKGDEKDVEKGRAFSLVSKGLAEEVTADGRQTKPAPAPKHNAPPPPSTRPGRTPTSRPAPAHSTKAKGAGGKGKKPPAPPPGSEGVKADEAITVEGVTITVSAHRYGTGDDAFDVAEASITGEPDQVVGVFAFRDGSAPPTGAIGDEAVTALSANPNAVLLDMVRIPAASGND